MSGVASDVAGVSAGAVVDGWEGARDGWWRVGRGVDVAEVPADEGVVGAFVVVVAAGDIGAVGIFQWFESAGVAVEKRVVGGVGVAVEILWVGQCQQLVDGNEPTGGGVIAAGADVGQSGVAVGGLVQVPVTVGPGAGIGGAVDRGRDAPEGLP